MPRRNQRSAPTKPLDLAEIAGRPELPRPVSTWRRNLNPPAPKRPSADMALATGKRQARRDLTECAMPLCHRAVARGKGGEGIGICSLCAIDISDWLIDLQNQPAMTERQLQRRYRDLKAQEDRRDEMERRAMNPGWIYYIKIDDRIKIGFSLNVKSRMRAYPPNAQLLAVHPGTKKLEREVHDQFRNALAAGREWFHPVPEVLEHIEQVVAQFGPPETKHIHKYREGQQQTIKLHRRSHRGSSRRPR